MVDERSHVFQVLAEDGRFVEAVNPPDDTKDALGLALNATAGDDPDCPCRSADGTQRSVLAVQETEGVHIVADRLRTAIRPGKVLPGIVTMTLEELV